MSFINAPLTQLGLGLNGIFSLLTGLLLMISPATVGAWLGVAIDPWLRLFGVALVTHFVIVVLVVRRAELERWVKVNLVAVAPYPLLMLGVAVSGVVEKGHVLLLLDGVVVGIFAAMQWLGLRGGPRISPTNIA